MNEKSNACNNEQEHINSYPALDIANTLISLAIINRRSLTQISILKLLYFMNGYYLVNNRIPLIKERFEACGFGPVLRNLYEDNLSIHGANPIIMPLTETINNQLNND